MTDTGTFQHYRRALLLGLLGGVVIIYLALVGIVERFEERPVLSDLLTLGLLAPSLGLLVLAYRATSPGRTWFGPPLAASHVLGTGLVAGLAGGGLTAAFLLLNEALPLNEILVNARPPVSAILGLGLTPPALGPVALGAGLGLAAALLRLTPVRFRSPLIAGLVSVLLASLMEPFMRVLLLQLELDAIASFFYRGGGLTIAGALLVFAVALAIGLLRGFRGEAIGARVGSFTEGREGDLRIVAFVVLGIFLLILPQLVGSFLSEVLGTVGLYVLMGLGLNIVVGYAGLLDLGYVAFFAIGAYATAILTSPASVLGWELSFWLALPIVIMLAAISGLIIGAPVLRLRGDYLAIVTLGIGEIVRILLLSDALRPWTGGAQGILQIPSPSLGDLNFFDPQVLYYPILFFVGLAAFFAYRLSGSRAGRAWNAMREDEDVAAATGVNTTTSKLLAFSLGAAFGCVAGAFFAVKIGSVFPHGLDLLVSITVLSLIILGGMGSIPGVIVGALVLVGLPELLREFAEYRLLVYGAVLVGMMLWRPEGLIPSAQRQRELHDVEEEDTLAPPGALTGAPAGVISGEPMT
jgi:branched-chain amino acid transport system permease protein